MTIAQERRLVTAIPGPESLARLDRKKAHVADGVGTMLPVFVVEAGGGVLVDVDGNHLIDLGSGIAVANVLVPGLIKRDFPAQAAVMVGLYSVGLSLGGAISAGLTLYGSFTHLRFGSARAWMKTLCMSALNLTMPAYCWYSS